MAMVDDDGSVVAFVAPPVPVAPRAPVPRDPDIEWNPDFLNPSEFPITVYRGDTREFQFEFYGDMGLPVDLRNYRVRAEIRDGAGNYMAGFTTLFDHPDPDDPCAAQWGQWHVVRLRLTHEESRSLERDGFWDLQMTSRDGWVFTPVRGPVKVVQDVTSGVVPYSAGG